MGECCTKVECVIMPNNTRLQLLIYLPPGFPCTPPKMYTGLKIQHFLVNDETDEIVYNNLVVWDTKQNPKESTLLFVIRKMNQYFQQSMFKLSGVYRQVY